MVLAMDVGDRGSPGPTMCWGRGAGLAIRLRHEAVIVRPERGRVVAVAHGPMPTP